ncbi:MAG: hypothetical protein K0R73_724 [Candidatus Midichloriaceae bacterium]|nr:hypothetical protein [Candidatus Midichloriaceae bacterium]
MEFLFIILAISAIALICVMIFLNYLASYYQVRQRKKRLDAIDKGSPYRKQKPAPIKPDKDFLSKDRGLEKIKEEREIAGVTKYNPNGNELESNKEQDVIVGVAEPVGIWSKFIMKQKIGFIIAMGGLQGNKKGGFWTNLIKAQAASRGKGASKGR